jgi:hypothetical protein
MNKYEEASALFETITERHTASGGDALTLYLAFAGAVAQLNPDVAMMAIKEAEKITNKMRKG